MDMTIREISALFDEDQKVVGLAFQVEGEWYAIEGAVQITENMGEEE